MPFQVNSDLKGVLERDPGVNAYLRRVAAATAQAVEREAPGIVRDNGRFYSEAGIGETRVVVDSPFWHWPEFGGTNFPHRPYIRPTVQRLLSAMGGRWDPTGGVF